MQDEIILTVGWAGDPEWDGEETININGYIRTGTARMNEDEILNMEIPAGEQGGVGDGQGLLQRPGVDIRQVEGTEDDGGGGGAQGVDASRIHDLACAGFKEAKAPRPYLEFNECEQWLGRNRLTSFVWGKLGNCYKPIELVNLVNSLRGAI